MNGQQNVMQNLLNQMTFEEVNATLNQLQGSFEQFGQVDLTTGNVALDEVGIRTALTNILPPSEAATTLAHVRSTANRGVLVRNGRVEIPWTLLETPEGISTLGAPGLQALGLTRSVPRDQLAIELGSQAALGTMPEGLLERISQPEVLNQIEFVLNVEGPVWETVGAQLTAQEEGGIGQARSDDPDGGDGGGGGGGGGGGLPVLNPVEIANCLLAGNWSGHWWGFEDRINEVCSNSLTTALLGAAVPVLLAAVKGAFSAALAAGATIAGIAAAAVAAAGGIIALAIAAAAFYVGSIIKANTTAAGVVICGCWWLPGVLWAHTV